MPNTVTLDNLRKRSRRLADQEFSNFVTDNELDDYVNDGLSELYDLIVQKYEDYFHVEIIFRIPQGSKSVFRFDNIDQGVMRADSAGALPSSLKIIFSGAAGNDNIQLRRGHSVQLFNNSTYNGTFKVLDNGPDTVNGLLLNEFLIDTPFVGVEDPLNVRVSMPNYYKTLGMDLNIAGTKIRLAPFMWPERNMYENQLGNLTGFGYARYHVIGDEVRLIPAPAASGIATLWYIPTIELMTNPTDVISFPESLVPRWERFIALYASIQMLKKEESPVQEKESELERMRLRIEEVAGKRMSGESWAIVDTEVGTSYWDIYDFL